MKLTGFLRTTALGMILTVGLVAQSQEPNRPDQSVQQNAPYQGQTSVPNNAAANDQPNTALSGDTPATNSSLQETKSGNLGLELGWLGVFGLLGLFGLGKTGNNELQHVPAPEKHRG